ncbi:hypothetical protein [Microbacterium sp. 179-I 3D4 NHS]|uniref:hypothetical protein n=1 Tax=Microbacterium sp. 179-I 3D4 NHS TaxID=3142381 RepID=UPI0039A258DE
MYENLHASQVVTDYERQQLDREVERRRFLRDHADQIVPRPEAGWRRMLRRAHLLGRGATAEVRSGRAVRGGIATATGPASAR